MRHTFFILYLITSVIFLSCNSDKDNNLKGGASGNIMEVDYLVTKPDLIIHNIEVTGSLLPAEAAELTTQAAGKVQSIHFEEGQEVTEGQYLLRIDAGEWRAQLNRFNAELATARKDLQRKKALAEVQGVSDAELEAAQLKVESLQAQIEEVKVKIDHTAMRAPFSGRIGLRFVSPGSYISSGSKVATLVQENPLKLEFTVPERYASKISNGKTLYFTSSGSNREFEAKIYAREPMINASSRSMTVRAKVENDSGELIPGSYADVRVKLDSIPKAIMVPTDAIIPELNNQMVYLIKNGKATKVQVQTGVRMENTVQIISGVEAGDTVILTGLLQLNEGMPVQVGTEVEVKSPVISQ